MKLQHPLAIRLVAALAAVLIRIWMTTVRVRTVSADGQAHPVDPATSRYIYAFWHEALLAPIATRPKARVLISQHHDGELIAQACQWLGLGLIRGSTARGGSQALLEMIRGTGDDTHLAITPDGPRGPRRGLKAGIVMVASQTGLPIVVMGIGFSRAWRASSWDRFAVPLPFTTIVGVLSEPIAVPKDLGRPGLQQFTEQIEARMLGLTAQAEDWARCIRRSGVFGGRRMSIIDATCPP
ncbi:MAG: lysophospholipid acyltransferase family protein, partial [Pirellulaceae bacterium]